MDVRAVRTAAAALVTVLAAVACNALLGNEDPVVVAAAADAGGDASTVDGAGSDRAMPDAPAEAAPGGDGGNDARADGGADGATPDADARSDGSDASDAAAAYDGPPPTIRLHIYGERPPEYGDATDGGTYVRIRTWLDLQHRIADLAPATPTVLVALDGFNRVLATADCGNQICPPPTLSVLGGPFAVSQSTVDAGAFLYAIRSTNPASMLHVPGLTDVCLVLQHPGWPAPRKVLVRVSRGDFNGDGVVDRDSGPGTDTQILYEAFGRDIDAAAETHTDLDCDGNVDALDAFLYGDVSGTVRTLADPCQ